MEIIKQDEIEREILQKSLEFQQNKKQEIISLTRLAEDQELGIQAAIEQSEMTKKELRNKEVQCCELK